MAIEDFQLLTTKKAEFHLTRELSSIWDTIATKLGLDLHVQHLRNLSVGDEEKLHRIWQVWFSKTEEDLRYYPTWDGLQLLLRNVGKEDVAKKYFDFLYMFY
jgi:hypothetical protein